MGNLHQEAGLRGLLGLLSTSLKDKAHVMPQVARQLLC